MKKNMHIGGLDKASAYTAALLPSGILAGPSIMEICVGLTCLLWIIRTIATKDPFWDKVIKNSIFQSWILWIIAIITAIVLNAPSAKSWGHDFAYLRFLIFAIAIADISYRFPIHKFLIFGLAGSIFFAALNWLSAIIFGFDLIGRSAGGYMNKLGEVGRIMIVAPFVASFFGVWGILDKNLPKKKRIIFIAISLFALILVCFTRGRTVLASILLAFCFSGTYFIYRKFKSIKFIFISVAATVLLSIFLILLTTKTMHEATSFYHRVWMWKIAIAMWLDNFFFGAGVSMYKDAFREMVLSGSFSPFISPKGIIYSDSSHAHNLFIMILSCTGIVGFSAFLWLLVATLRKIFEDLKGFHIGLTGWIVSFLANGLLGFSIYHSSYMAYFAFFIGLLCCRYEKREFDIY